MAARLLVASVLASVLAVLLIPFRAAAFERHVIGPRLERRLLSSQAPGRQAQAAEMVDVLVRARGSAPTRMRLSVAQANALAAASHVERVELAPRLHPLLDRSARDVRVTDVH